jgi:hypothetical protein
VRQHLRNYQRLRTLVEQWIAAGLELSRLRLAEASLSSSSGARTAYGEALTSEEEAVFCTATGRSRYAPPPGGWREVVCITGRQSGKSRIAAVIADAEAIRATHDGDDSEVYALLVAQDHRGAMRTLLRYARAPFQRVPVLRELVRSETADTLSLTSGVTLAAYPCRPPAVRGLRACVAIADELAFFRNSEASAWHRAGRDHPGRLPSQAIREPGRIEHGLRRPARPPAVADPLHLEAEGLEAPLEVGRRSFCCLLSDRGQWLSHATNSARQ